MMLQQEQPVKESLDGVCLSARSAASHAACRAGEPAGCRAGELCMQPLLARDEHLYKVCIGSPDTPFHGLPLRTYNMYA